MKGNHTMTRAEQQAAEYAASQQKIVEAAYRLFSQRNIDSVKPAEIAREVGLTVRTLQRHFKNKDTLVIETATWAFQTFTAENRKRNPEQTGGTAADVYAFFLDSFLRLYRERGDLLRFNQFFNVYVRSEKIDAGQLKPYGGMIDALRERFRAVYEKGRQDGTLRTDYPEEVIFSATLHLMLAVVTRYAVGLVYDAGVDPEQELLLQKRMLLREFTTTA